MVFTSETAAMVNNKESQDFPKVDIAYIPAHDLRAGHEYRVVFNANSKYPQIDSVLEEIEKTDGVAPNEG
jgi:hypothetical protein